MSEITASFPRLNQFWNDSGVLGLYRCIIGNVHAERPEGYDDPMDRLDERFDVRIKLEPDGFEVQGEEESVNDLLEKAYDRLVAFYYNVSTQKQKEDRTAWNFYYNSSDDKFEVFPKRKARGIAAFIYDKAPRPAGSQVKWSDKEPGRLPATHAHLQSRLDTFLQQQSIQPGPPSGMLMDQPNQVRPKVRIRLKEGKPKGVCFLCGQPSAAMEKVSQTVFPFITGDSGMLSFFSMPKQGVSQVCWRCAFVGKFVPVNGFYTMSGNRLHTFFPFAPSLTKMNDVYDRLKRMTKWEPNFWRNFEHPLGGYFSHPAETGFAFLYAVYNELIIEEHIQGEDEDGYGDEEFEEDMFDLTLRGAPLSFAMVSTNQKGQTQMPTQVWLFDDLTYLFRLFQTLKQERVDWRETVRNMLDSTAARDENRSLERNRMLDAVLRKRPMLRRAEAFAFHVNRGQRQYIAPLVNFVNHYEGMIKKGGAMKSEALDAAVKLGKRIGYEIAQEKGKKGSLFTLRKCRTLADFLNELTRLQLRFGIAVPPAIYQGHLTNENFEEFRGFCMLAALNTFNAGTAQREQKASPNQGGGTQ